MVASQSQDGRSMSFALDPALSRVASFIGADGTATVNHYTGNSDSPAWAQTAAGWTRNLAGVDGGLAATVDQGGNVTVQLANLHGDIVATVGDDPAAVGPDTYSESTEYGQPRDPVSAPDTYGWLGGKQRSTNSLAGLALMGVRLYNPATGRFLSVDPIPGGNPNAYTYPVDPINGYDLDGQWGWHMPKIIKKALHKVQGAAKLLTDSTLGKLGATACSYAWGVVGTACGTVYATAYAVQGRWKDAAVSAVQIGVSEGVSKGSQN